MPGDYSLYINNEWKVGLGPTFDSHDPATGKLVWQGTSSYESDVNAAVLAAREASTGWSNLSIDERIHYLKKFGDLLKAEQNFLAEVISKETGKPLWESKSEVTAMFNKIEISIEAYKTRCPEIRKEQPAALSITRHRPHGVVAVFGPYNFPGHLPNGHIIPALLAGNTVILKPSELAPWVAESIIQLWEKTGLPKGVINLLQGGHQTGSSLANHAGIDGLFFTGSWNTGQLLAQVFAKQPYKILALEMGGNNPLIVADAADLRAAAYLTIQSAFLTSGQRCTCARRLIVPEGRTGDAFVRELTQMIHGIKVGPYTLTPEPFMGPVISKAAAKRLLDVQMNLTANEGHPLVTMQLVEEGTGLLTPGLMDVTAVKNRPDEEYFGPFLQLIRVKDFDAAIEEANKTSYGLAAGLLSDKKDQYDRFYKSVRAGVVNWNTQLTGASSSAPFGGIGRSGNHRPSALYAADYCAYPVASMETPSIKMPSTLSPGIQFESMKSHK